MKSYKMQRDDRIGCYGAMLYFIVLLLLICLCTRKASGQGAVYVLYQPVDLGIGVRVDYKVLKIVNSGDQRAGLYHSVSYGSEGLYKLYGLGHHFKFTTGVLIPLPFYLFFHEWLSIGVSYHVFSGGAGWNPGLNPKIYNSWSYETGMTVQFKRLAVCVSTDIPRWEPCIGIGYVF